MRTLTTTDECPYFMDHPVLYGSREIARQLVEYCHKQGLPGLHVDARLPAGACGGGWMIGYHGWRVLQSDGSPLCYRDIPGCDEWSEWRGENA